MTPDSTDVVRRLLAAYLAQDEATARELLDDGFRFTSPQDDRIDTAAYFARCFPTAGRLAWQEIRQVAEVEPGLVFLRYEYALRSGERFQNVEALTVREGRVADVQVYFGGPPAAAPSPQPHPQGGPTMKHYLLSIEQPDGGPPDAAFLESVMRDVAAFNEELKAAGAWVFAGGLERAEASVVVRFHGDDIVTTDGPYEREEEHAGGICIVAAPDYDAALEWGRKLARATTLPVEVREFRGEPAEHLP